jgi:hypothetical protein
MVTIKWYGAGIESILDHSVDFENDTIKVALCDNTYTPSQDGDIEYVDIEGELAAGSGYTVGGAVLDNCTVAYLAKVVTLDADDVSWPSSSFTARYAVAYTSSNLLFYVDFGANVTATSEEFKIVWNASGICTVTIE